MRRLLVAAFVLAAGCDSPTEPFPPPQGSFELTAAARGLTLLDNAQWEPLPWSYVRTSGTTDCTFTLQRGSLVVTGNAYDLVLEHETNCPEMIAARIEEQGTISLSGGTVLFRVSGEACRSWIPEGLVEGGEFHTEFGHPCLQGSIRYLRFATVSN